MQIGLIMTKIITKICTVCKVEKELNEYGRHIMGRYGRQTRCKSCDSNASQRRYALRKEMIAMEVIRAND